MLGKTKALEKDIDILLERIQNINQTAFEAVHDYMRGEEDHFQNHKESTRSLEAEIDTLRIHIEHSLYGGMLIPESRGDVLGILESLDDVADSAKEIAVALDIERPEFPDFVKSDFLKMARMSHESVEELMQAVTLFFKNSDLTGHFINKVNFYEHEIDALEEELKRKIFSSTEIERLSHKMHLRFFVEILAQLSDEAESVCQRLTLSTMKRSI